MSYFPIYIFPSAIISTGPSCFDYTTCNPDRTISLVDLSMVSAKLTHQKYVTQSAILENFEANFEAYKKMPSDVISATAYHEVGHYIVSRFSKKLIDFDSYPVRTTLQILLKDKTFRSKRFGSNRYYSLSRHGLLF